MVRQRPRTRRGPAARGRRAASESRATPPVEEVSAGGLVVDRSGAGPQAVLIARRDRAGTLLWSMPKGHVEPGESVEDAAVREVEEETGIRGRMLGPLGEIDYSFASRGRRVHKTVHFFLLEAVGGELSDADVEVAEVAWMPLAEARDRLAYADERLLVERVPAMLTESA